MPARARGRRKPAREVAPRRVPTQRRGRQRVERILDAAARVFDEVGYEAATTNAIASRAGVPIGSLYQFFPNKSALLHALAARYRDEVRALFEATAGPGVERLPLRELVERVIEDVSHFHRTRPGFRALMSLPVSTPELEAGLEELQQSFDKRMAEILAVRAPRLAAPDRELIAAVSVRIVHALMLLAVRRGGSLDVRMVEQIKEVLGRYLEPLEARGASRRQGKRG